MGGQIEAGDSLSHGRKANATMRNQVPSRPYDNVATHARSVVGSMEGVKRDGDDLVSELSVPVWSALLGCEAHVETLLGWVRLPVPVGTQHGDELRVRGAGAGIR